jgi:sugar O-acyltransferase (sialic acid O-acetyltransferase NeuD family)
MTKDLVIFGAGGHAREVLQVVEDLNAVEMRWRCLGFCVDPEYLNARTLHGLPIHAGLGSLSKFGEFNVVVGVGDPSGRRKVVDRLRAVGHTSFPTLIHPRAWIGSNVRLGAGSILFAGVALTTDIQIGEHVHANLNVTISHDSSVGDFSTLSPGVHLAGGVRVGDDVEIGTGTSVIPKVQIGSRAVVGAGAAVVRDVPVGAVAAGVPARVIRMRAEEAAR